MKRTVALLVACTLLLSACGQPLKTGSGFEAREYPTYGIFNEDSSRSDKVCYEVSFGNVVWSIILFETVIAPIYFIGWSIKNPVRLKKSPEDRCNSFD